MKLLPCLLLLIHATLVAHETPTPGQIQQWITHLGSEDFAARQAASGNLRRAGRAALPQLRDAAAQSRDAEAIKRIEALLRPYHFLRPIPELIAELADEGKWRQADYALKIIGAKALPELRAAAKKPLNEMQTARLKRLLILYPPERAKREPRELYRVDVADTTRELFEEYQAEERRLNEAGGTMDKPQTLLDFMAPLDSNYGAILRDFRVLLRRRPEVVAKTIAEMHSKLNAEESPGITPYRFLGYAAPLDSPVADPKRETAETAQLMKTLAARENTPTPEEWRQLRPKLDLIADKMSNPASYEKVSMIFHNASVIDVWHTIAIQADQRIYFDPPELLQSLATATVSMRVENMPWQDALRETLRPHNLDCRIEEIEGAHPFVLIFKAEK